MEARNKEWRQKLLAIFMRKSTNMELSLNTPALLFPAITLLMLAYTNRFLGLASLIRTLHSKYIEAGDSSKHILEQIKNLRTRLYMIRNMQFMGALSFFLCVICMFCIFSGYSLAAEIVFACSLASLLISLGILLREIQISTRALDLELGDMEELTKDSSLLNRIRSRFDRETDG